MEWLLTLFINIYFQICGSGIFMRIKYLHKLRVVLALEQLDAQKLGIIYMYIKMLHLIHRHTKKN